MITNIIGILAFFGALYKGATLINAALIAFVIYAIAMVIFGGVFGKKN
ncbi:hypothetical protein [Aliivibrio fischeri]|nr:hypothetical protein [Aliivibrio fischeri]